MEANLRNLGWFLAMAVPMWAPLQGSAGLERQDVPAIHKTVMRTLEAWGVVTPAEVSEGSDPVPTLRPAHDWRR